MTSEIINPTTLYRIKDWDRIYENNRTRELKKLDWVPIPNKQDGDGFTELMSEKNGTELFGAWILILQVASKCSPRGTLQRQIPAPACGARVAPSCGTPHTPESLARITRAPVHAIRGAIEVCVRIGWMERINLNDNDLHNPAPACGLDGTIPHPPAEKCLWKGIEGNRIEKNIPPPAPPAPARPFGAPEWSHVEQWVKQTNTAGSDYTVEEARIAFLALEANGWKWGRNQVADWRSAIECRIQEDRTRAQDRKTSSKKSFDGNQKKEDIHAPII